MPHIVVVLVLFPVARQLLGWHPECWLPHVSKSAVCHSRRHLLSKRKLTCARLAHVDFSWLVEHYGEVHVYAQASSRTREDTSDGTSADGTHLGLPERRLTLRNFVTSLLGAHQPYFDYVKMLDDNFHMHHFDKGLGTIVETELRAALLAQGDVPLPRSVHWSLWVGAEGSVTSMHADDQAR